MSSLEFIKQLLQDEWQTSVTGRVHDVPQPKIDVQVDDPMKDLKNQDVVIIRDGGDELHDPQSVGHLEERVQSFVSIDVRTTDRRDPSGHVRLEGGVDRNGNPETHGGLKGEIKRILDANRTGTSGYDTIQTEMWRNLSAQTGRNHYRGVWDVRLDEIAKDVS